jgi:hypothetical protein
MIQRASLDLAIIKCKLLKMNNVNKILPALAAGAGKVGASIAEGAGKVGSSIAEGVGNAAGNAIGEAGSAVASKIDPPDEGVEKSEEQKKITDKRNPDEKVDDETKKFPMYKSDDIVDKAIELINEAYDEMKSTDFRKLKPTYEGDTKEAKKGERPEDYDEEEAGYKKETDDIEREVEAKDKSGADGGTSTTGTVGAANFVYSDVAEAKKNEDFIDLDDPKNKEQAKIIRERLARANESIGISDKKQ